jgi:hypothetical protein
MTRFRMLPKVFNLFLVPILLAVSLGGADAAVSQRTYSYANGIQIAAGTSLPIFHISSPVVTATVTLDLTQNFLGIYSRTNPNPDPEQDTLNNHSRFTYFNEANNAILEQFGATGGFYAYNPSRAFGSDNPVGGSLPTPATALHNACMLLLNHSNALVPSEADLEIPGISNKCDYNFVGDKRFKFSTEWLTGQNVMPGQASSAPNADIPLRLMVTMPIILQAGRSSQGAPDIPLGGPGGHISMIFYNPPAGLSPNTAPTSLDSTVPGVQAIAMPAHGRSFSFNRSVPALDPAVAQAMVLEQVQKAYPDGKNIQVPPPSLEYVLSDASTPQKALEPDMVFSGITVDVGGETLTLKDLTLPAVESGPGGLGPTVEILSPTNEAFYPRGSQVSLQGQISDGTAPYRYDWQLGDGTSLKKGDAAAAGVLPLFSTELTLPDTKNTPGSLSLSLVVTDTDGITRQAQVVLVTPAQIYFPISVNASAAVNSPSRSEAAPAITKAPNYVYTFGVEYGSDYPPYGPGGPDLSGVPPDANGFSAGLWSLGWWRIFNWYNSLAWERDWRDCSLGGSDCTYGVDRADFVYYSGHGNNGGIAVPSNGHDSSWFDGINARYQNARWVGFSSCLTLRAQWDPASEAPIRRWFNAFQGAHMLLGFNSVMGDVAFGGPLIDNMRMPSFLGITFPWAQRTIAEAWVQTAFQMNAGKPAYIYAWRTGVDPSTNKLPQVGDPPLPRPYPVQWFYWVWWDE